MQISEFLKAVDEYRVRTNTPDGYYPEQQLKAVCRALSNEGIGIEDLRVYLNIMARKDKLYKNIYGAIHQAKREDNISRRDRISQWDNIDYSIKPDPDFWNPATKIINFFLTTCKNKAEYESKFKEFLDTYFYPNENNPDLLRSEFKKFATATAVPF